MMKIDFKVLQKFEKENAQYSISLDTVKQMLNTIINFDQIESNAVKPLDYQIAYETLKELKIIKEESTKQINS